MTKTTTEMPEATLENWRRRPYNAWAFSHVDRLVATQPIRNGQNKHTLPRAEPLDLSKISTDGNRTIDAALADSFTDGFMVLHRGQIIAEHYGPTSDAGTRHIVFSVSKSLTGSLAGVLVERGELDVDQPATRYVPELASSAYGDCTVRHILDMTVSVRFIEDYLDPKGDVARYRVAMDWDPPRAFEYEGGLHNFVATLPHDSGPHGEKFHYVSPNSDVLGWILERAGGMPMAELLSHHIWQPMGAENDAYITVDRQGGARTAGGICTTVADLARFGELMRLKGRTDGRQVIPESWIDDILNGGDRQAWARGDLTELFASGRYRSKWYIPDDVPGEFCAIGIHGQWIYVDQAAEMTAVKLSSQPIPADDDLDQQTLQIFRALGKYLKR